MLSETMGRYGEGDSRLGNMKKLYKFYGLQGKKQTEMFDKLVSDLIITINKANNEKYKNPQKIANEIESKYNKQVFVQHGNICSNNLYAISLKVKQTVTGNKNKDNRLVLVYREVKDEMDFEIPNKEYPENKNGYRVVAILGCLHNKSHETKVKIGKEYITLKGYSVETKTLLTNYT